MLRKGGELTRFRSLFRGGTSVNESVLLSCAGLAIAIATSPLWCSDSALLSQRPHGTRSKGDEPCLVRRKIYP